MNLDWVGIHGICMFIGFGMFTTCSVFIALYFRSSVGKSWLDIHLRLQLISLLLCTAGIMIMQVILDSHFNTVHSIMGTVCFVASSFVQPIFGLPDEDAKKEEKK